MSKSVSRKSVSKKKTISLNDQNQLMLELMLTQTDENIVVVEPDLTIGFFNESFAQNYQKFLGRKVQAGDPILEYTYPNRRKQLKSIYQRVFKGETVSSVIVVPLPDGEQVIFENRYKPVVNDRGEVIRAFVNSRDVTEDRKKEELIQRERIRLQKIMDQSVDIICTAQKGVFTSINAAVKDVLGYKPEEIIGTSFTELVHPDDINPTRNSTKVIYNGKELNGFENRYRHKKGHWVPLIWSARWNAEENIIYAIARDASPHKKYQSELRDSESRLKNAQRMARLGYWQCNAEKKNWRWSDMTYELLGFDQDSIKPGYRPLLRTIHPDDRQNFRKAFDYAIENQQSMDVMHRILLNNEVRYVHHRVTVSTDELASPTFQGTIHDVTEIQRQKVEQELVSNVVQALQKHEALGESLEEVLQIMSNYMGVVAAESWISGRDGETIFRKASWSKSKKYSRIVLPEFDSFEIGVGLPGVTARSKKLENWNDLGKRKRFHRREAANAIGLTHGIGVPVILNNTVLAVFTFFDTQPFLDWEHLSKLLRRITFQVGIDIERKLQTEQLNQFFNFSPNLICIVGKDGFFRKVNPAFTKLLGYSEKELLSRPFHLFLHPDDREESVGILEKNESGYVTNNLENRYLTKKGEVKWISWFSSEHIDNEGFLFGFGTDITAIKEANLEMLKYKNIVDYSKDGIGLMSLTDDTVFLNEGFISDLGYTAEELVEIGGPPALYPDKKLADNLFSTIFDGKYWHGDVQIRAKNGTIIDYFLSSGPIFNDEGNLIAVFGIHTDIRKRKRQERELEEAYREKSRILESIDDGFFSMNPALEITYWNREAERLTGVPREKITGKKLTDIYPESGNKVFSEQFFKALDSDERTTIESYFNEPKGWFQVTIYPSEDGTSIFFKDITEQKIAEGDKNRLLEVIDRSLNEVYIFSSDNLKFEFVNQGALKNLGYSMEQMMEKTPPEITPAYDDIAFRELVDPLFAGDQDKIIFETVHLRADKSHYPVEVHLQLVTHNERSMFVAVILDITDRMRHEADLKKLNRQLNRRARELAISNSELEQFAYIASHDLQEPLRMVTSFLTRLEDKYGDQLDEKAHQYINFATDGARRMRTTILDLLEFSRVDKSKERFEKIDLNALLTDVLKSCEASVVETNAKVEWNKMPNNFKGQQTALKQLFQNLVSNAIKYKHADRDPKVEIRIKTNKNEWEFSVSDNGIGMEERFYDKIFMIFQRLHQRDDYPGTGIGLAICKKIVDYWGGKIWVQSKQNEGSVFYFTMPKK